MNVYRSIQGLCLCGLKVLYWVPVIFVLLILLWAYYVYVYVLQLSGDFEKPVAVSVVLLLVAHVILLLFLSSYFRTIFTTHKPVPPEYCLNDDQLDRLDDSSDSQSYLQELSVSLPMHQVTKSGGVRYCTICEQFKPDRTHHCSTCHRCVLKMDHHCPWVNNCVGFSNYKYFVLFLFYTVTLCVWFCGSSLYDFIQIWEVGMMSTCHRPLWLGVYTLAVITAIVGIRAPLSFFNYIHGLLLKGEVGHGISKKFNVTFCFVIVGVFSLSTSALLVFHLFLVCTNCTTIENMESPLTSRGRERKLFHVGIRRNIQAVFGRNLFYAFLPISTSEGNGASFPIRGQIPDASYHSLGSNHGGNGLVPINMSGSESEVEIFAVHDKSPETQPLTPSPASPHD